MIPFFTFRISRIHRRNQRASTPPFASGIIDVPEVQIPQIWTFAHFFFPSLFCIHWAYIKMKSFEFHQLVIDINQLQPLSPRKTNGKAL